MRDDGVETRLRAQRSATEDVRPGFAQSETRLEEEAERRIEAWLRNEERRRTVVAPEGRIEAVEEAGGGRSEYGYDRRGDLVRIVEAGGRRTTFGYDEDRRLARVVHPDGASTSYAYEDDRLARIDDRGVARRFEYDAVGRVSRIRHGGAGASVYRYDEQGRIAEARTSTVSTAHGYHPDGRIATIRQSHDGVTIELRLEYDEAGRLKEVHLPGSRRPVRYAWDESGRPTAVALGEETLARFEHPDGGTRSFLRLRNGIVEETQVDRVDLRPVLWRIRRGEETLLEKAYAYGPEGRLTGDGDRRYGYDDLDRLVGVEEEHSGRRWSYEYDVQDNRIEAEGPGGERRYYHTDADDRLTAVESSEGGRFRIAYDAHGRPVRREDPAGQWTYRYDDAGQLIEARHRGDRVARFIYDHSGRLAAMSSEARSERYLYGPDDRLFAVTDQRGAPLRLYVWTPGGLLAEVLGDADTGTIGFHHHDRQGACHLVTGEDGSVAARWRYDPFGLPSGPQLAFSPMFGGRNWYPEVGMYYFGARWYDPGLGRFLTPDTFTGRPDDARLVHPGRTASLQGLVRAQTLGDWLKQPRVRNRYAFCHNDPVGRTDPDGHWSFGWTLLSVLGAVWTLPNTFIGLFLEITCLVGEVLRWLVWAVSLGNLSWQTPGFDVAASSRLNAFALVFSGGWFPSALSGSGTQAITFGNVFFTDKTWKQDSFFQQSGDVYPPAYKNKVAIPREQALYEHELRHTNQYGWFGPFFLGVYLWDWILSGFDYGSMWVENNAKSHGGYPP